MAGVAASPAPKRPPAFAPNWPARIAWLLLAAYVLYALGVLDVSWERVQRGIPAGQRFLARMWPPALGAQRQELLLSGLVESLQIAVLATAFGILLSLPLGLLAARNLVPRPVAWTARALIALCRSFHPIIVAILFVKAVGFGALAGVLALVVASMGFISKLFAEAVEEMSLKQVEAVRATGAGFFGVLALGVLPQVMARFIGFGAYQLDSNLRNSTMVGIVGGGGIGAALFTAYQRFDYDFVLTILIAIIALIMVGEILSQQMRRVFQ